MQLSLRADPILRRYLAIGVVCAPLVALAGAFLMTIGTDESWIQLSIRGLARGKAYGADSEAVIVHTTGGLYTLASCLLQWLSDESLIAVRLLSVGSVIVLLQMLRRQARARGAEGCAELYPAALVVGVPGLLVLGGVAYAAVMASTFALAGILLWGSGRPSRQRAVLAGLVFGLAVGMRMNLAPVLVVPLVTLVTERGRGRRAVAEVGVTLSLALVCVGIQRALLSNWTLSDEALNELPAHGVSVAHTLFDAGPGFYVLERLGFLIAGERYLPSLVRVGITVAWLVTRSRHLERRTLDGLLSFAWALYLGWLFFAPIAHLRYLLPSTLAFAVAGGLVLVDAVHGSLTGRRFSTLACAGVMTLGYLHAGDAILYGEQDLLSWEWNGRAARNWSLAPFSALKAEREVITYIRERIPPEDTVAEVGFGTALAFATGRDIRPVEAHYGRLSRHLWRNYRPHEKPASPKWLVTTPFARFYPGGDPPTRMASWISEHCEPVSSSLTYSLCRLSEELPDDPAVLFPPESR